MKKLLCAIDTHYEVDSNFFTDSENDCFSDTDSENDCFFTDSENDCFSDTDSENDCFFTNSENGYFFTIMVTIHFNCTITITDSMPSFSMCKKKSKYFYKPV